jgi:hypothetical protein
LNSVRGNVPGVKTSTMRAYLAAGTDFLSHGRGNAFAGMVLNPHRHYVEPVGIGEDHDLEFIADAVNRPHRVLDLARKHFYAAQID